jgi:Fic family protein
MLEPPERIEPCFFEDGMPHRIADLAVELQRAAGTLGQGLHPDAAQELADFVRMMNCYYSNLIEGHNTRPRDIERALRGAEVDPERRPLALEARAHVVVQREIDAQWIQGAMPSPTSSAFLQWAHRRFYEEMPEEFRVVEHPDGTRTPIVPGQFRDTADSEIEVGRHQPPSSERVGAFMDYFSWRFGTAEKHASRYIVAIASAHHRLNYVHPFPDGNGRVSRLMSHAMAHKAGIGGNGLWSVSRGLARGLREASEYKRMMDHADSPRQGDRDGRGNLSLKALEEFCEWFLAVMLDQIRFASSVFDLERLNDRYRALVKDVVDDRHAPDLISTVLRHGALDRGDAPLVLRVSERTARNTLRRLVDVGFLQSRSPKTPVRIAFPLDYRERLFPNLFADADINAPEPPDVSVFSRP